MELRKLTRLWVPMILGAVGCVAQAATTAQIDTARAKGLAWLVSHQNGEGYWQAPEGLEIAAASEAMQAYANAGMKGMPYGRATSWMAVAQANSVDSLARKVVALKGGGHDVADLMGQLMTWRTELSLVAAGTVGGGWGAYDHFEAAHPDTGLALSALRLGLYSGYTGALVSGSARLNTLCNLVGSQQSDGSWTYVFPIATNTPALYKPGAIAPTAYNIVEWAASTTGYSGVCGKTPSAVLNSAATWLITNKKQADGGFGDGASSAMDTALVYRALTAINSADATQVAAKNGALDYLVAKQGTDGSWGGDAFTTALVLAGLPATTLTDTDKDGVPDAVEAVLATSTTVAGRDLFGGGTLAPPKGQPTQPALPTPLARSVSTPAPAAPVTTAIKAFPAILQVLLD